MKITLDMLTDNSVSVKNVQTITGEDGNTYETGEPWRKAYVNSARGREEVQNEVQEPYKTAIFAVWGDAPTVSEIPA